VAAGIGSRYRGQRVGLPVLGVEDTELGRAGGGLAAAGRAEFGQHGRDVAVDRADRNHELAGDLSSDLSLVRRKFPVA